MGHDQKNSLHSIYCNDAPTPSARARTKRGEVNINKIIKKVVRRDGRSEEDNGRVVGMTV